MYRRGWCCNEDPWITWTDHNQCNSLYHENGYQACSSNGVGKKHNGLNVFIRKIPLATDSHDADKICQPQADLGMDIWNWDLVRRTTGKTYSQSDKLAGSQVSGSAHDDPLGATFSKRFDTLDYDQFLFTTGDCKRWMIMDKSMVLSWYANGWRTVVASHTHQNSYSANVPSLLVLQ
jgi:hypothetical protein